MGSSKESKQNLPVRVEVGKDISKRDFLYIIEGEIEKLKTEISAGFLRLGMLFKYVKEEKLYELDKETHPSFKSFCAQFGFNYKSVQSWVHIYELYVLEMGRSQEELQQATWGQLQVINPVVKEDPDRWIGMAQTLSRGDLINEVRKAKGKEEMGPEKAATSSIDVKSYEEYVAASPCCVCGRKPIEKAHFPRTRVRAERPWHYIPLCHDCHIGDLHQHGINHFLVLHKNNIFKFFYDYIENVNRNL